MALKSKKYWEARAIQREAYFQTGSNRTINQVKSAYTRAMENINAELRNIERNAAKAGVDEQEPYQARAKRFTDLREMITQETAEIRNLEISITTARYQDVMNDAYYRTMFDIQRGTGFQFGFAALPKKAIKETLVAGWKGRNYSKSVWNNTHILAKASREIITAGLQSGASIRTMTEQLSDAMDSGKFAAERLIRTETSFFMGQGELESYKEADIEKYQYVATLDDVTSKKCRGLDTDIFLVSEAEVGVNYPPAHPLCRSTTRMVIDGRVEKDLQRRARDPDTGKTYLVPANTKYSDWISSFEPPVKSFSAKSTTEIKFHEVVIGKDEEKSVAIPKRKG